MVGIKTLLFVTLGLFFGIVQTITADAVRLTWTAVGDDGLLGTATEYDLRFHTSVITEANFAQATRVLLVPRPQVSGAREIFYVDQLQGGVRYYFALKVGDEQQNWSSISNVVSKVPCPRGCIGMRGNVDNDNFDELSIVDVVYLVSYIFDTDESKAPECSDEADIDGSGYVNVADLVRLVEYFFAGGQPPEMCP